MNDCSNKIVYDIFNKITWKEISIHYDFSHRHKQTKINEETARQICSLLDDGKSSKEISEIIGCKIHVVKDIRRGKTWSNIMNEFK